MDERIYTINLRRGALQSPRNRRSKRAMSELIKYLVKHMKTPNVKISEKLNEHIWQNGMANPIVRVKVAVTKDKDNVAFARLYGEPAPMVEEAKKTAKKETTPAKKEAVKPVAKDEAPKEAKPETKDEPKSVVKEEAPKTKDEPQPTEKKESKSDSKKTSSKDPQ